MKDSYKNAKLFGEILRNTKLPKDLTIGNFRIDYKNGIKGNTILSKKFNLHENLLDKKHNYTFQIMEGNLEISLELCESRNDQFRLFCNSSFNGKKGMLFMLNLDTQKDAEGIIFLTQKIKFVERLKTNENLASEYRRNKQLIFTNYLRKLGLDVTDNNDLIFGIFDTKTNKLLNTTAQRFINDFIAISIIKGHFMGNKGYELEILPSYKFDYNLYESKNYEIEIMSNKMIVSQKNRTIPLGIRFKILERDNGKCVLCGKNPEKNGVILHIDHVLPYSLGGLTEMNNLQTLCSDCNIGKSNKSNINWTKSQLPTSVTSK
ncbi:HNH endonuclease [Gillisia mitskevichiae]|uniref:HNH endonuclease n=1 Tax=Gillisia mitskevichiae TaxID=270921 RepID=A0A495P024_9FLAO|nr:HNH endonuclease [Gillisia mitskevichiae]RKS42758.1 HNH endonuclease [Gillisia mitskevichiae]